MGVSFSERHGVYANVVEILGETLARLKHYPTLTSTQYFELTAASALDGFRFGDLKVGDPLVVEIVNKQVVAAQRPQKPFTLAGLQCCTANVQNTDEKDKGIYVEARFAGNSRLLTVTPLTPCFQAQQDPDLRHRIQNRLKVGDSLNLWFSGDVEDCSAKVEVFSINYR